MRNNRKAIIANCNPHLGLLRNIASACRAPGFAATGLSNGTDTTSNSRCQFTNESGKALTSLSLIYSGWYTDSTSEAVAPNAYTITASIEYPSGTFTQVTWSGTSSVSIPTGSNILSDMIAVAIPAGATFWIRTFLTVTAGQKWAGSGNNGTELSEHGVGLADKTLSGTISGNSVFTVRPSAILAPYVSGMKRVCYAVLGDSLAAGSGDGNYDASNNTGGFSRAATGVCPVITIAVGGTNMQSQVASGKLNMRLDLLRKAGVTHVLTDWSVNDISNSRTQAQIQADMLNFWQQVQSIGAKPVQTTLTPETTTTDAWQTVANQTVLGGGFSGGTSSIRSLVNANTRTVPYPLYDFVEISYAVESAPDSGKWGCGSTFSNRLGPVDSWTVGAGSTATVVTSNSNRATNYYQFGGAIVFTSGALNGVRATVASNTSGGAITVNSALSQAPSNGDTFLAYPLTVACTNDGEHPNVTSTGSTLGGHYILKDQVSAKLNIWNGSKQ